jgi:predicted small lipoprotein YifL
LALELHPWGIKDLGPSILCAAAAVSYFFLPVSTKQLYSINKMKSLFAVALLFTKLSQCMGMRAPICHPPDDVGTQKMRDLHYIPESARLPTNMQRLFKSKT